MDSTGTKPTAPPLQPSGVPVLQNRKDARKEAAIKRRKKVKRKNRKGKK